MIIRSADAKNVGITLRPYRSGDLYALHELDQLCFESSFRFSLRSMRRFLTARNAFTLVAETSATDQIAGFIITHREVLAGRSVGYIVTLDVRPALVRSGIATTLLASAETELASQGAVAMRLHVHAGNAAAIAFYEGVKYRSTDQIQNFYGPGLDAFVYEKSLFFTEESAN